MHIMDSSSFLHCEKLVPNISKVDKIIWAVISFLTFVLVVILLYSWGVFSNDYNDFDWFVYENTGFWFAWSLTILIVLVLIFSLIFFLLLANLLTVFTSNKFKKLYTFYKIFLIVSAIIAIGSYIAITKLWNDEWATVIIALQMMLPFIQLALVVGLTITSWFVIKKAFSMQSKITFILILSVLTCCLLFVYVIPVTMHFPCVRENINDISKPKLIGHRGFPKMAPENTMMSFELALNSCDLFGMETDISISWDGVPFLIHDRDLKRTTNISDVYPKYTSTRPEYFKWDELKILNAGKWFLEDNPYHTKRYISTENRKTIEQQAIPKLSDVSTFLAQKNLSFIFDLARPPNNHPYRQNYTFQTLKVLIDSGMLESNILWLSEKNVEILGEYPNLKYVCQGSCDKSFQSFYNISGVNLQYNLHATDELFEYQQSNISIIMYQVYSPWLFSWCWCQGIDIVTTSNCQKLSKIARPIWQLTNRDYLIIWLLADIISLVIILGIFHINYKQWRNSIQFNSQSLSLYETSSSYSYIEN